MEASARQPTPDKPDPAVRTSPRIPATGSAPDRVPERLRGHRPLRARQPLELSSEPDAPQDGARSRRIEGLKQSHREGRLTTPERLLRAAEGLLRSSGDD